MTLQEKYLVVAGTYRDFSGVHFIAVLENDAGVDQPFVRFGGVDDKAPRALGMELGRWIARAEYNGTTCEIEFADDMQRISTRCIEGYSLRPLTSNERTRFIEWYERGRKNFSDDLDRSQK